MNPQQKFSRALKQLPLAAILRGLHASEALAIGQALVSAGWTMIEVPLNSPSPFDSIATIASALPDALVGAGTVLTAAEVRSVHAAGGELVVSPNFNPVVVQEALRLGMVCLPGVMTASEAFAALDAGAHGLKMFPAEMVTPAIVKALRAVLPAKTVVLPVGGIGLDNMRAYLAAGASGFGIGSARFRPGMAVAEVALNAAAFARALAGELGEAATFHSHTKGDSI